MPEQQQPVDNGAELVSPVRSFLRYVVLGISMIVLAFAVTLYVGARTGYRACVERNARSETSAVALEQLAAAHRADGNVNAARVWQNYLDAIKAQPLPECHRPPFTKKFDPNLPTPPTSTTTTTTNPSP